MLSRVFTAAVFLIYALQCSHTQLTYLRITDGEPTTIEEHPYMIHVHSKKGGDGGGTLISPTCVLSAAHNFRDLKPQDIEVYAGKASNRREGQIREVFNIYVPENYNVSKQYDMDVAILQLKEPVAGENISEIELELERDVEEGDALTVAGWGLIELSPSLRHLGDPLRDVNLFVLSQNSCGKDMTENMFCARGNRSAGFCAGDSGGPAVNKQTGKQVGIVSWNYRCGFSPSVFTRLSSKNVSSYVTNVMNKHC